MSCYSREHGDKQMQMLSADDIQDLIDRARAGDDEAFCDLVRDRQGALRSFLARYIDCTDDVYDLAQEVFIIAHRNLKTYRDNSDLDAWLRGIARNKCRDHLRAHSRRLVRERQAMDEFLVLQRLDELDDESTADYRLDKLRHCVEQLKAKGGHGYRLIDHRYLQGQPIEEVARCFKMTNTAVRMALSRLRRSLKSCIEQSQEAR